MRRISCLILLGLIVLGGVLAWRGYRAASPRAAKLVEQPAVETRVSPEEPAAGAVDNGAPDASTPRSTSWKTFLKLQAGELLRALPQAGSEVVATAPGIPLEVSEKRGAWYRVRLDDESEAWVQGDASKELRIARERPGPRGSVPPDPERIASARALMKGGGEEATCGPYALITDWQNPKFAELCRLLGGVLDNVYVQRYGVKPVGQPGEVILVFTESADFRAFSRKRGQIRIGYAAHASASDGYLALQVGDQSLETLARTLAHELTHLVNRRAVGGSLPRWLSEGLADGIGDTASLVGLRPLEGIRGSENEGRRLLTGIGAGQARSLKELVELSPEAFDASVVSYDYEHSALFVRFLLVNPDLAPGFRRFLTTLVEGSPADGESLRRILGVPWDDLDRRFRSWLRESLG